MPNGYDNSWQGGASTHLLLAGPIIKVFGSKTGILNWDEYNYFYTQGGSPNAGGEMPWAILFLPFQSYFAETALGGEILKFQLP